MMKQRAAKAAEHGSSNSSPPPLADPPRDPETGLVMTKRAIRRRIVKTWERKQKMARELQVLDDTVRHVLFGDTDATPGETDVTPSQRTDEQNGSDKRQGPPDVSWTPQGTLSRPRRHPLHAASRVPFAEMSFFPGSGDAARNHRVLPEERPPFEFFFRWPDAPPAPHFANCERQHESPQRVDDDSERIAESQTEAARVDPAFIAMLAANDGGGDTFMGSVQAEFVVPSLSALLHGTSVMRTTLRRLERERAVPLQPFAPGTNLNVPPQSYLEVDPLWGVHKSAPGFFRDPLTASSTLYPAATRILRDDKITVNVLSSGEAMSRLFEAAYRPDSALTLHVHRLGPSIVVQAPEATDGGVAQARKKTLLSKALYRMRDAALAELNIAGVGAGSSCGGTEHMIVGTHAPPKEEGAALVRQWPSWEDSPRAGSVDFARAVHSDKSLITYTSLAHYSIQNLEVLVGLDTPVLVDTRSVLAQQVSAGPESGAVPAASAVDQANEMTLVLRDANPAEHHGESSPTDGLVAAGRVGDIQWDALRCWFDATLANIANVGICVHNEGTVQSFQVKKVNELLSLVEGQVATAAMTFTAEVLKWLLEHCCDDGSEYVVLRDAGSQRLELFALTGQGRHSNAVSMNAALTAEDDDEEVDERETKQKHAANTGPASNEGAATLNHITLATLCYQMGTHFRHSKPHETLRLWLRALPIYSACIHSDESRAAQEDILKHFAAVLEDFIGLKLRQPSENRTGGVSVTDSVTDPGAHGVGNVLSDDAQESRWRLVPEVLKEALLSAMRVESVLLRQMQRLSDDITPGLLLRCSIGFSVVVSFALNSWAQLREWLMARRREVVHRQADSLLEMLTVVFKELAQVVLEGLSSLERIFDALRKPAQQPMNTNVWNAATPSMWSHHPPPSAGLSTTSSSALEIRGAIATTVDVSPLISIARELLGDVYMNAVADSSSLTVRTLADVSQCMLLRDATASPIDALSPGTCLSKLTQLTTSDNVDVPMLCLLAVGHYAKVRTISTRRVMRKMAQSHYLAGCWYFDNHRWTKSLEHFQRSLDVLRQSESAEASSDVIFDRCTQHAVISGAVVRGAVAACYAQMACLRWRRPLRPTSTSTHAFADGVGVVDDPSGLDAEEERCWILAIGTLSDQSEIAPDSKDVQTFASGWCFNGCRLEQWVAYRSCFAKRLTEKVFLTAGSVPTPDARVAREQLARCGHLLEGAQSALLDAALTKDLLLAPLSAELREACVWFVASALTLDGVHRWLAHRSDAYAGEVACDQFAALAKDAVTTAWRCGVMQSPTVSIRPQATARVVEPLKVPPYLSALSSCVPTATCQMLTVLVTSDMLKTSAEANEGDPARVWLSRVAEILIPPKQPMESSRPQSMISSTVLIWEHVFCTIRCLLSMEKEVDSAVHRRLPKVLITALKRCVRCLETFATAMNPHIKESLTATEDARLTLLLNAFFHQGDATLRSDDDDHRSFDALRDELRMEDRCATFFRACALKQRQLLRELIAADVALASSTCKSIEDAVVEAAQLMTVVAFACC